MGIAEESQRPYGAGVEQQALEAAKRDAATMRQPAPAPGPSPSPTPQVGGGVNPGPPMRTDVAPFPEKPEYDNPVMGGLTRATDWLSRGFSNALGAVPGPDGQVPLAGAKGPTDRTNAGDFLPAIARTLLDHLALPGLDEARMVRNMAGAQSFTKDAEDARVKELSATYGDSMDEPTMRRVAQLEEMHNRLGGTLLIEAAIVTGFTGVGIAVGAGLTTFALAGAADIALNPEGATERIARGEGRLPQGSVGRAVVENTMPELAALQPLRGAYNVTRARLGLARMAGDATQVAEMATEAKSTLEGVERTAETIAAKGGAATTEAEALADVAKVDAAAIEWMKVHTPDEVAPAAAAAQNVTPPIEIAKTNPTGRSGITDVQIGDVVSNPGSYKGEWEVTSITSSKGKVGKNAGKDLTSGVEITNSKTGEVQNLGGFDSMDVLSRGGQSVSAPAASAATAVPRISESVIAEEEVIAAATRTIEREGQTLQTQLQNLGPLVQGAMNRQIARVTGAMSRAYDVKFLQGKYAEDWRSFYGVHSFETIDEAISALQRTADANHVTLPVSLLDRLGAARAAAENVSIQQAARKTIWQTDVKMASEAKAGARNAATKAGTAAAKAGARVESGTERLARAQERLTQVQQDAEQAQRMRYQQDVTAAADQVGAAEAGTAPEAIAKAAAPKVEAASAEVTAAADAERIRLARRASSASTKVGNMAQQVTDRVAARMADLEKKIATTTKQTTTIAGDNAPKMGYVTEDSQRAWDQARLHTGKFDWGSDVRQAMVDYATQHGDQVEQQLANGRVSMHTLTTTLAAKTGADVKSLERTIKSVYGGDHKVLRTFYVADEVLGTKMREWHDAGVAFSDGRIDAAALDKVTGELTDFQTSISLGKGEIGRILGSFRLQKTEAAGALRVATAKVKISNTALETATKQLDNLAGQVADATEAAAKTQERISALEDQSLALTKQIEDATKAASEGKIVAEERAAAEEALAEARANLNTVKNQQRTLSDAALAKINTAQAKFDEASAAMRPLEEAHAAANDAAAVASDAARKSQVDWATKLKLKPEDMRALSYVDPNDTEKVVRIFRDNSPQSIGAKLTGYMLNSTYGNIISLAQNVNFDAVALARRELFANLIASTRKVPLTPGWTSEKFAGTQLFDASVERAAQYTAIGEMGQDAWHMFSKIIMQGEAPEQSLKYGMESIEQLVGATGGRRPMAPGMSVKSMAQEGILRFLNAPDMVTRLFATGFEQRRMAALKGSREGGAAGAAEALARVSAGDPESLEEAARIAARMTTNDVLDPKGWTATVFINPINKDYKDFRPGAVLIPAARWGFAYQRNSLRGMGIGIFTGIQKARAARGLPEEERIFVGREAAHDMAEGLLGAGLFLGGFGLLNAGLLTGAAPDDIEGQRQWKEASKQPVSVKIAGNWIPLSALGSLGVPLALSAMIGDPTNAKDDWTQADRVGRAAQLMGRYITDVPAFSGTYRLLDAIRSSAVYGWTAGSTKLAALLTDRVVVWGGALNSLVPVFDTLQRSPEDFLQMLSARLPGGEIAGVKFGSEAVPPVMRLGEPQERPVSGPAAINPFGGAQGRPISDASKALQDNGVNWTGALTALGGQTTTKEEQRAFESASGPLVKEWSEQTIASDIYRSETNPIKRQAIMNNIVTEARNYGREMVAYNAVVAARTPEEVTRAAKMSRSVQSLWQYATTLESFAGDGRLTADVGAALDKDRGMLNQDTVAPTVQEVLAAIPVVRQYLALTPFTRGTAQDWAAYDAAMVEATRIEKTYGPQEADLFRRTDPTIRLLAGASNPQRTRFLERNPQIKPYVAGLRHQGEG